MPGKSDMTYEELLSVYRQESRQTTLSKVSSDFYDRIAKYLEALDKRCIDNKDGAEVSGMLHSQLKTAREKSAGIYESRMRKIMLLAMSTAFGAEPRIDNATPEERSAFQSIKEYFISHRKTTLSPKCNEEQAIEPMKPVELEAPVTPAKEIEEQPAPKSKEKPAAKTDTVLVRILEDLPVFAGADKNYHLMREDIIDLPRTYAEILLRNNKAVEIKQSM